MHEPVGLIFSTLTDNNELPRPWHSSEAHEPFYWSRVRMYTVKCFPCRIYGRIRKLRESHVSHQQTLLNFTANYDVNVTFPNHPYICIIYNCITLHLQDNWYTLRVLPVHIRCNMSHSRRVRVVRARPGSRTAALFIIVNDANNRAVSASNHQESTRDNNEAAPANHQSPLGSPVGLPLTPVVVQPHATHRLEAHERAKQRTDQRNETAEHGHRAGDDVRDESDAGRTSDPGAPVDRRVVRQMLRAAEDADEDVLGGEVGVQRGGDDQPGQGEAVAHSLHGHAGGAEGGRGHVGAAEVVDDDADDDVDGAHAGLAHDQRARVAPRVAHLGHDREVAGHAGEGEDERRQRRHGFGEAGRREELVVGLPRAGLRRRGGPVLDADRDGEGEDCWVLGILRWFEGVPSTDLR